jgi:hypothetical protein
VKIDYKPARDRFLYWIKERQSIYERRLAGKPKPWTSDPILQQYRFCNVYRELDTVTQWIASNWRESASDEDDLWFAMCVARFINWPDTLEAIGYPVPWQPKTVLKCLKGIAASDSKVFTGAYIVSTNGLSMDKAAYIVDRVLTPLWTARHRLRPVTGQTLAEYASLLLGCHGLSGFMAGQVIADLKYATGSPLRTAKDWWSWAISGPGSRRGLSRVLSLKTDYRWKEQEWFEQLTSLKGYVNHGLHSSKPRIHAQNIQNCLCEFDKYERVRLGEGRPRSRYNGS